MPLEITSLPIEGISKTATFEYMTISQISNGSIRVAGKYRIELIDKEGQVIMQLDPVTYVFEQDELIINPNFGLCYLPIRDLARSGLAKMYPELVKEELAPVGP